jgi:ribosome-associated protein
MDPEELKYRNFEREFVYSTSKSGGPGGQNVNKVSTKVELRLSIILTSQFSSTEKELIFKKLKNKINKEGELLIISQSERTQHMNKIVVTEKFYELVSKALTVSATRRATKPTVASKHKRLEEKKSHGLIKKLRKNSGRSHDID